MPPIPLISARYPPPVVPGSRLGIAALSGPVDPTRLAAGCETLGRLGFEPVLATNLGSRAGFFAGSDRDRLDGFHGLLRDPSIDAIVFARGGHGLLRLLPSLDWELLASRPRAFVGYSDLTPLLNLIPQRLGWVTFHGPMAAVDLVNGLSEEEEASWLGALAGRPSSPLASPRIVRPGVARGHLLGGCLSLLTAVQGTPYAPSLEGSVLFWEDVGESPYRLDRMLTHLTLSGSLTGVRGMVIGEVDFGGIDGAVAELEAESLANARADLPFPIAAGLSSGHRRPNLTLPIGAPVELDALRGELTVLPCESVESA